MVRTSGKKKPSLARQAAVAEPKNSVIRRYVFTLNNPPKDLAALKLWLAEQSYACFGEELSKTGTPHLQGYVSLNKPTRFLTIKKKWEEKGLKPFIAKALGSQKQNRKYCSKEGDDSFWEAGEHQQPGKRTDVANYLADATIMSEWDLSEAHPHLWANCRRAGQAKRAMALSRAGLADLGSQFEADNWVFNAFQVACWERLQAQNNRAILWVADPDGRAGKSTLGDWLTWKHDAFYIRNGKNADIACAFQKAPKSDYVIMDLARCQIERVNYGVMEMFKDGKIFAAKYDSTVLYFKKKKVVVFANFYPDLSKLTADRWDIMDLGAPLIQAAEHHMDNGFFFAEDQIDSDNRDSNKN